MKVNRTFNLPIYNAGETLVRGQPGWHTNGMIPNIVGTLKTTGSLGQDQRSSTSGGTGALSSLETSNAFNYGSGGRQAQTNGISFDASMCSGVYNNTTTYVRPAGIGTNFCIKYI